MKDLLEDVDNACEHKETNKICSSQSLATTGRKFICYRTTSTGVAVFSMNEDVLSSFKVRKLH